ncbi:MAG: hypothetical protein WAL15_21120 [Xanthobacteraceae bacterium]
MNCSPGSGHFKVALLLICVSSLRSFGDSVKTVRFGEPVRVIVKLKIVKLKIPH